MFFLSSARISFSKTESSLLPWKCRSSPRWLTPRRLTESSPRRVRQRSAAKPVMLRTGLVRDVIGILNSPPAPGNRRTAAHRGGGTNREPRRGCHEYRLQQYDRYRERLFCWHVELSRGDAR